MSGLGRTGGDTTPVGGEPAAHEWPALPRRAFRSGALGKLVRDPGALVGLALIVTLVGLALLAPLVATHNPSFLFDDGTSDTGAPLGSSAKFLLGTDPEGRDVLSRLLWGARTSLSI